MMTATEDTRFWIKALDEYRASSGDKRRTDELPLRILSNIIQRAQQMKDEEAA